MPFIFFRSPSDTTDMLTRTLVLHGLLSLGLFAWLPVATAKETRTAAAARWAERLNATIGRCACDLSPLTREAGERALGVASTRDLHDRSMDLSVVSDEFALKLFQEMTVQHKIPFGYPEDGCFARAHEMSFQLEKRGILTGKVFATGRFRIDSEKAAKGSVTWGFHVAPVLVVDTGKARKFWVIDPSLFYEPVSLEAWLEALTAHPKSSLTSAYLTKRFIYHPSRKDLDLKAFDPRDLRAAQALMKRYLRTDQRRIKKSAESF